MNLAAIEDMNRKFPHAELCFVESGGDNLAASPMSQMRTDLILLTPRIFFSRSKPQNL